MDQNEEGKAEKVLKDFGKKLDQFFADTKNVSKRAEGDLKKKYEDLKASAEKLKGDVKNKERWKEVEDNLKKAGKELENAVKAAFKKREG